MSIDVTLPVMVLPQQIPHLEMSSISVTTAGKSIAAGYFSLLSLLKARIRQGQDVAM